MKVSIIVTTNNKYLSLYLCLRAIKNIKFNNFEVVIVNNSNNPKINNIISKFINKFKYSAIVINSNSSDTGTNHNKGLLASSGEYVIFLDSKDILYKKSLNMMYSKSLEDNSDVVICKGYYKYFIFKKYTSFSIDSRYEAIYQYPCLVNKLIRREVLLNNLFITDSKWDEVSNIPVILDNYKISYINIKLCSTYYNIHDFIHTDVSVLDIIKVLDIMKKKVKSRTYKNIAIMNILLRLENMYYSFNKDEELISKLKDYLYLIDNYWNDYEIVKLYSKDNIWFRHYIKKLINY
jgi:glycosyltransferase involved in cell wall biosynthesis